MQQRERFETHSSSSSSSFFIYITVMPNRASLSAFLPPNSLPPTHTHTLFEPPETSPAPFDLEGSIAAVAGRQGAPGTMQTSIPPSAL